MFSHNGSAIANGAAAMSPQEPRDVTIGDKTYKASVLRMRAIARIQRWLDEQPPPRTIDNLTASLAGLDPREAASLRIKAVQDLGPWPPDLLGNLETATSLIRRDEEGVIVMLQNVLGQHQTFSREDAERAADEITMPQWFDLMAVVFNIAPMPGDEDDPKAAAEADTVSVATTM